MPKAVWNGVVIAQSEETLVVEGRHYFPPEGVHADYLKPSATQSVCPWKGTASYYHVEVGGKVNSDAAFTYPQTKPAAKEIERYIAFWKGVEVVE
jgi:uncharacterized protein (DUF427 family)